MAGVAALSIGRERPLVGLSQWANRPRRPRVVARPGAPMRCTAVAVVCFVAAAPIGLFAQQPTFKSGVEAVRLDVAVTRGGKPIHGLTTRDFSIRDNGVRQRVESVSSVDAGPLNVLMVLDTSRSVSGHRLMDLVDAGRGLLAALRPADRAAPIQFS